MANLSRHSFVTVCIHALLLFIRLSFVSISVLYAMRFMSSLRSQFQSERPRDRSESCFECFIYTERHQHGSSSSSSNISLSLWFHSQKTSFPVLLCHVSCCCCSPFTFPRPTQKKITKTSRKNLAQSEFFLFSRAMMKTGRQICFSSFSL